MEGTYLAWLVGDIWDVMMLEQDPDDLMGMREICPWLKIRTEREIFWKQYRERWMEFLLAEGNSYGLIACRAPPERILDFLGQRYLDHDYIARWLDYAHLYRDELLMDYIVDNWGHRSLIGLYYEDLAIYDNLPAGAEFDPTDSPLLVYFLDRYLKLGTYSAGQLCMQTEHSAILAYIQRTYPQGDYTEYLWDLMNNQPDLCLTQLSGGLSYDPQLLMIQAIQQKQEWLYRYLKQTHSFSPSFLYHLTGLVKKRNYPLFRYLVDQSVLDIAISFENVYLVTLVISGELELSLASLFTSRNFDFIHRLLLLYISEDLRLGGDLRQYLVQPLRTLEPPLPADHPLAAFLAQWEKRS